MSDFVRKVALYDQLYKTGHTNDFMAFLAKAEEILPQLVPATSAPAVTYAAVSVPANVIISSAASVNSSTSEDDYFGAEGKSMAIPSGDLTAIFNFSGVKSNSMWFSMMRDYYRIHPERFTVGGGHTSGGEDEPHITIGVEYDQRHSETGEVISTFTNKFHAYYKSARSPRGKFCPRVFTRITGYLQPDGRFATIALLWGDDWSSA